MLQLILGNQPNSYRSLSARHGLAWEQPGKEP